MINLPKTRSLILEQNQGWLTIWLNSPQNRNALSSELLSELKSVFVLLEDERQIRGVSLRGAGGVFCAGGDLKAFKSLQSQGGFSHEDARAMNRAAGDIFDRLLTLPQVVLAFVDGAAIAGGLGLMGCADIITVTRDAKFALTETKIGIPPAQIAPILVARVGAPTARRLMLTAARFNGDQAQQFGLADFVVENADGFDAIEANIRREVLSCAPGAIAFTKTLIASLPHLSADAARDFAADGFATALLSPEGREGIASFVEKRKPNWSVE